jgi:argininosuccinate synthase
MFTRSVSPETAPDKPTYIEIGFENGDPVSLNGAPMSPATILEALNKVSFFFPTLSFPLLFQKKLKTKKKKLKKKNKVAGDNGVGRVDIVESRFVGMKSRGVYETPGGTVLLTARRGIESICLDRGEASSNFFLPFFFETFRQRLKNAHFFSFPLFLSLPPPNQTKQKTNKQAHLKDELMPRYAELIYNGFWFSPEREALQAAIDSTQKFVKGTVRVKLYKGNVVVVGRKSPYSLYDDKIASFEDDAGAYDQKDAAGFIKLQALRLRTLAANRKN